MPHSTAEPASSSPPTIPPTMGSSVPVIPGFKAEHALAEQFRQEVADLLGRKSVKFPGAQPVSFARAHLQELEQRDYFLCEKTDGIRCLLYCTQDETGQEIHYMIDRRNDYYFLDPSGVRLHLPHHEDPDLSRPHVGTLIDGELVNDHEDGVIKLRYLAFDLLAVNGRSILEQDFSKRIGKLHQWVMDPYTALKKRWPDDVARMPFEMQKKRLEKPYAIQMMFLDILPKLPHGNDGFIFQCATTSYVVGTDDGILKWKPPQENTIDFMLRLGDFPMFDPQDGQGLAPDYDAKPPFELWISYGQQEYRYFEPLYVSDEEWDSLKSLSEVLDGRIIECYRDEQRRWRYKVDGEGPHSRPRFRDDKPDANHYTTAVKVLATIDDGVTEKDLYGSVKSVKNAWKKRHPDEDLPKKK